MKMGYNDYTRLYEKATERSLHVDVQLHYISLSETTFANTLFWSKWEHNRKRN
jgi:hypothetical protein